MYILSAFLADNIIKSNNTTIYYNNTDIDIDIEYILYMVYTNIDLEYIYYIIGIIIYYI